MSLSFSLVKLGHEAAIFFTGDYYFPNAAIIFGENCLSAVCSVCAIHSRMPHGSSEGHEMLKRNDKYHSTADDVPIPKM